MKKRVDISALPEMAAKVEERIRLKDRRRQEREKTRGTAIAVFHDRDGGPKTAQVALIDASGGGVGIVSYFGAPAGSRVEIRADAGQFEPKVGTVVRCGSVKPGVFRMGLRVVDRVAA